VAFIILLEEVVSLPLPDHWQVAWLAEGPETGINRAAVEYAIAVKIQIPHP